MTTKTSNHEAVYIAALLHAGPEPRQEDFIRRITYGDPTLGPYPWTINAIGLYEDAHQKWQLRVAEILMQGWEDHVHGREALSERSAIQHARLTDFYTWLCIQRGEAWAEKLECVGVGVWR